MATAKKVAETAPEKSTSEATELVAEAPTVDRVVSVSYRADGTPDQTEGFELIDPDAE